MIKYGRVAERNSLRSIPAVFSRTSQTHSEFKAFVREQVRRKLIDFEGEAKSWRIRAVMRWWSKRISMTTAKAASRNVAFKVARMREAIMEDQDEFLMRKPEHEDEVGLETNNRAALEAKRRFAHCQSRGQHANLGA